MSARGEQVCARARQLVSALLDGRLDAARRGALQRHLLGCAACLRVVRETERLARATHNLPQHRAAPDLAARVQTAARARRSRRYEALDDGVGAAALATRAVLVRRRATQGMLAAAALLVTWWFGYTAGASSADTRAPEPLAIDALPAPDLATLVRGYARAAASPQQPTTTPSLQPRSLGALDAGDREQLGALVELERQLMSGHRHAGREFVQRIERHFELHGSFSSSFSFATASAGVQSLGDAGLEQDAAALQQLLQAMLSTHARRGDRDGGESERRYGIVPATNATPRANMSGATK